MSQLAPGVGLVSWDADGFPTFHPPAPDTTLGGRPSVETTTSGGAWRASLGGTETITIMIPRGADNWFQMDARLSPNKPRSPRCSPPSG